MIQTESLSISTAIFCDDIRFEKSNKFILVGVTTGDLIVPRVPARVSVAVYLEAISRRSGEIKFFIQYAGPGEGAGIINAQFNSGASDERIALPVLRSDVLMECEGAFRIAISEDGDNWVTLFEKQIQVGDVSDAGISIEQPPPPEQSPSDAPQTSAQPEPSRQGSRGKRRRS